MLSLLPPHYSDHERNLELIGSAVCDRVLSNLWSGRLHDPMVCDARFLRTLGKYYGVEYWWQNISEEEHRNLIKNFRMIKRRRGTLWAVKQALFVIDPNGHILEGDYTVRYDGSSLYDGSKQYGYVIHWAQYIVIASRAMINAQATQLRGLLESVAPARSHLNRIDYTSVPNIYDGSINYDGNYNYGGA